MFWHRQKHEPETVTLTASMPDPSDPQNNAVIMNWVLSGLCIVLGCALAVSVVMHNLLAAKPPTTIVVDRCSELPPQVFTTAGAQPFAVQDARNFFINMVKLRYGWSSTTVGRDIGLLQTFSMEQQRIADDRYFSEEVEVPGAYHAKKTRMMMLAEGSIQNHLVLPQNMDEVQCQNEPENLAWHCRIKLKLLTEYGQVETGQAVKPPEPTKETVLYVYGTLMEGKRTVANSFGMMLGRMEGHEPADKEGGI
jgi:hypothetical protein